MSRNPTDMWARELRLNERETVVSCFLLVMEGSEFEGRTLPDAAMDVAEAVQAMYSKIEGAVAANEETP